MSNHFDTAYSSPESYSVKCSSLNDPNVLHLSKQDIAFLQSMMDKHQSASPNITQSNDTQKKQTDNNINGQQLIDSIISSGHLNPEKMNEVTASLSQMSSIDRQKVMKQLGTAIEQNQITLEPNSTF